MKRIFLVFLLWLPLISHAEWKRVTYSDDGSVVAYFDPDRIKRNGYTWDSIVPNSMGEDELRFICKQ